MKTLLSRLRFEALALGLAALFCALHVWVDDSPGIGTRVANLLGPDWDGVFTATTK